MKKEEAPKKPKPQYPSTVERVANFVSSQLRSSVPSADPRARGQVADYDASTNRMGYRVFQSKADFDMIDEQFKREIDRHGNSMLDIARQYWDDPEFAERQRREIAEGKRRAR